MSNVQGVLKSRYFRTTKGAVSSTTKQEWFWSLSTFYIRVEILAWGYVHYDAEETKHELWMLGEFWTALVQNAKFYIFISCVRAIHSCIYSHQSIVCQDSLGLRKKLPNIILYTSEAKCERGVLKRFLVWNPKGCRNASKGAVHDVTTTQEMSFDQKAELLLSREMVPVRLNLQDYRWEDIAMHDKTVRVLNLAWTIII